MQEPESDKSPEEKPKEQPPPRQRNRAWDLEARGEPFLWGLGGALVLAILMILGFLGIVLYNGAFTFYPKPVETVTLRDGKKVAGELFRTELFKPEPETLHALPAETRAEITQHGGMARRILYRTGNFDLYNEDFRWVSDYEVAGTTTSPGMYFVERLEWGPFIGEVTGLDLNGRTIQGDAAHGAELTRALGEATKRRDRIHDLERNHMGKVNYSIEKERLALKEADLRYGKSSPQYRNAEALHEERTTELNSLYTQFAEEAKSIRERDAKYTILLADVNGKEKKLKLSEIVRLYPANELDTWGRVRVYLARWAEFLTQEPREANTEGGVLPAIFGTFCMTVLLALAVAPFGVVTALYLREYAKQGRLVSLVRICVNNLAGVPSIVYGVFGLGFFAYLVGGTIDEVFFPERLPSPTFGTGGLLWGSLTLALLTVPVVIVATEEALAAVPQSMREGSLACGASKWQTIKYIVLPRAMPGIMTGLILAMARGAGEVAPLMLVGVVKMAPELPIDSIFPYVHLERSFMHLGFHIYDVGFQSRNSEAAKPMVYVTTLLLITLVFMMNAASVFLRNRLKKKFFTGHF
ncbi:MAG: phosphate ABC transporter permease PstA [Thermodesulfobacteriota bacterium]